MSQPDHDEDVRELLQRAGARPEPSKVFREQAYAAALEAWDEQPEPRDRSRWYFAAAASVAFVAGFIAFVLPNAEPDIVVGELLAASSEVLTIPSGDGSTLTRGVVVDTANEGTARLRLGGHDVRLAGSTRATLLSTDEIELEYGRIYIDAVDASRSVSVVTAFGVATDIGTQFEVSIDDRSMSVAVRDGAVALRGQGAAVTLSAGHGVASVVALHPDGRLERSSVSTMDGRWQWAADAGGDFPLKGASMDSYLSWATRELGLELEYSSQAVQAYSEGYTFKSDAHIAKPVLGELLSILNDGTDNFTAELQQHRLIIDFRR